MKRLREKYIFTEVVSVDDLKEIITKQVELAKNGNPSARDFLFNRIFGTAIPKQIKQVKNSQISINFVEQEGNEPINV